MSFDKSAYERSDSVKYKIVDLLNKQGIFTTCFEDKCSEDIKALFNVNIEVEHRTMWKGDKFPYDTISIPYRKLKHKKYNTYFMVINDDITYAYLIHSFLLDEKYFVRKNTSRLLHENFFHVPINLCKKMKIDGKLHEFLFI